MSRQPLLTSAITFLRDPSTATSPLAQRIQFLESKGLTNLEIQDALAQASQSSNNSNGGGNYGGGGWGNGGMGRRELERDWRDWFIMGVVTGTVGYLVIGLTRKYLLPHLQPPSKTSLDLTSAALDAKYEEASNLLLNLQTSTDTLIASLEDQKKLVEIELVEVRKAVLEMREAESKRESWSKKIGDQVNDIVQGLPKMLEKQASSQSLSLTDLSTELKSLKSLLLSRRPTTTSLPTPSISASASTPSLTDATTPVPVVPTLGRQSSFGVRPIGIPAWQLKGSSTTPTPAASPSTPPVSAPVLATPAIESISIPSVATAVEQAIINPTAVPFVPATTVKEIESSGVLVQKEV